MCVAGSAFRTLSRLEFVELRQRRIMLRAAREYDGIALRSALSHWRRLAKCAAEHSPAIEATSDMTKLAGESKRSLCCED